MGRTAESYLRESETKLVQPLYAFTEYTDEQLDNELAHTWEEQRAVRHGEERTAALGRKVQHILFELNCRLQEELEDGE